MKQFSLLLNCFSTISMTRCHVIIQNILWLDICLRLEHVYKENTLYFLWHFILKCFIFLLVRKRFHRLICLDVLPFYVMHPFHLPSYSILYKALSTVVHLFKVRYHADFSLTSLKVRLLPKWRWSLSWDSCISLLNEICLYFFTVMEAVFYSLLQIKKGTIVLICICLDFPYIKDLRTITELIKSNKNYNIWSLNKTRYKILVYVCNGLVYFSIYIL